MLWTVKGRLNWRETNVQSNPSSSPHEGHPAAPVLGCHRESGPRPRGQRNARPQGRALGELDAAHARSAARQGRPGRLLGVHLHQLDPHLALRQGVEPRLRQVRPGRGRRACARVRVRQARREHRPRDSRPRAHLSDRARQRFCDLAGLRQRRVAGEVPLRRARQTGEAVGGRRELRRDRSRRSGAC